MKQAGISAEELEAVVLWEDGSIYTASSTALRIVRKLRFPGLLLYAFIRMPPILRDAVYKWMALHRYRWFGKQDTCRLNPEEYVCFLE